MKKTKMKTKLGAETTKNLYTFPLIGFFSFVVFNRHNNTLEIICEESGRSLRRTELPMEYKEMDFEKFLIGAKEFYVNAIEISN